MIFEKSKKRIVFLILIVVLATAMFFSGCSYFAYKTYYSSIDDYEKIWELSGFRHSYNSVSHLFPKSLENRDVKQFYCRYDEQLPLGEGFQIFLMIQYADADLFNLEIERIESLSFNCNDFFSSNFDAYAVYLGEDYTFEYSLIDHDSHTVYYILLQDIPKNEIEFDHNLIPNGYSNDGVVLSNVDS